MIKSLIYKSIEVNKSLRRGRAEILFPSSPMTKGLPTLRRGVYQDCSPMLSERYSIFGRWEHATHGHWLSVTDMEKLWEDRIDDEFLTRIKISRVACEENWANDAAALFKPERLSLFSCDDNGNERIYILWLDSEDEPELWVYDSNGESRYKNLEKYLEAYLDDDLSAHEKSWRA
ncbi:MAG: hypothetical protein ACRYG8_18465 [Janthinobacterium lividum]